MKRKLDKNKDKYIKDIYKNLTDDNRLNYVYAVALMQNIMLIILHKNSFTDSTLRRFLVNEYIPEQNKLYNQVDLGYMSICRRYINKKYPYINFDLALKVLLEKLNEAEKRLNNTLNFNSIEEYLEFLVNDGLDKKTRNIVYNFVVKD